MLNQNDIKILKSCFLFEGIKDNLNDLLNSIDFSIASFQKGDVVFGDNSNKRRLGILLEGKATAVCCGGEKSSLKNFSLGEIFGAASIFCGNGNELFSKIMANTSCKVLLISREGVEKIIKRNPQVAIKYIEFLSNRVEFLNKRISTFTSNQSVRRLAKYILDNTINGVCKDINFSSLARSLDISRASFYRAKNELENSGAAILDSKKITLIDEKILRSFL